MGYNRFVTSTGRAISPGRVTRASKLLRNKSSCRPLPIHLQCHPKRMAPTSINPGCQTYTRWRGAGLHFANVTDRASMFKGKGLHKTGRFALQSVLDGHIYGYTDNANEAFAWKQAAIIHAIHVEVIDNDG